VPGPPTGDALVPCWEADLHIPPYTEVVRGTLYELPLPLLTSWMIVFNAGIPSYYALTPATGWKAYDLLVVASFAPASDPFTDGRFYRLRTGSCDGLTMRVWLNDELLGKWDGYYDGTSTGGAFPWVCRSSASP
jgi:hypothetical protein